MSASPPAPELEDDQRQGHRYRRGQLVDEEEQQVECDRERGNQECRRSLGKGTGRQQPAENAGDEEIAVAHHRRPHDGALQTRQAGGRVSCVERVVGALKQV